PASAGGGGVPRTAARTPAACADVRGQPGRQSCLRADGGRRSAGTRLLPSRAARLWGGRGGLQLVDSADVGFGLRGHHRLSPCAVLPLPGGVGSRRGGRPAVVA